MNLSVLEDSFPHCVCFALTDTRGEVLWKFTKKDHQVNEIVPSSMKSWMLNTWVRKFSDLGPLLALKEKPVPFASLPSIIDSSDDKTLLKDNQGIYLKVGNSAKKHSFISVRNMADNSGLLLLESLDGNNCSLAMSVKNVSIVAHTAFAAYSHCLLNKTSVAIDACSIFKGKESSDFEKTISFLLSCFEFSPATLTLKKFLSSSMDKPVESVKNVSLERTPVINYDLSRKGLNCVVRVSKMEVDQTATTHVLEIHVEQIENKHNSQQLYIAANSVLPSDLLEKEIEQNSAHFKRELRKALDSQLVLLLSNDGRLNLTIEKQPEHAQRTNGTERLLTLFSDFK